MQVESDVVKSDVASSSAAAWSHGLTSPEFIDAAISHLDLLLHGLISLSHAKHGVI